MKTQAELKAESVFRTNKKKLISKLGNKGLYDDKIDKVGKELFGKSWNGCHASDKIVFKPGYQVINVDTSKMSGSHWLGIYETAKTVYIYDSFGRYSHIFLKKLSKKITHKNLKMRDSDYDAEQRGNSEICGQGALAWLCVVKELGIKKAILI